MQTTLFDFSNFEAEKSEDTIKVAAPPDHRWLIAESKNVQNISVYSDEIWKILNNRNIFSKEQLELFVAPEKAKVDTPDLHFKDLPSAIKLVRNAITQNEKIAIVGDYDADGMTSTALLIRVLRNLGADISYQIPDRISEGYAINPGIVEKLATEDVKLIITVDNGITSLSSAEKCRELGIKLIITDHHEIPQILPDADAILNPRLLPEDSIYANLAGVGVAYILASAVSLDMGRTDFMTQALTLAAIGTVADMASLTGINRRWVKRGMKYIENSGVVGIDALVKQARLKGNNLSTSDIGFKVAPMINAVGRIGNPQTIIELLTTEDINRAEQLAVVCASCNYERQILSKNTAKQAIAKVEQNYLENLKQDKLLFVVGENWHPGVIGLAGSKLVEKFGVPAFVGTVVEKDGEKQIKFSARGIPEFSVGDAMRANADLFIKFGGHPLAGGGSLKFENYDSLRQGLINFANKHIKEEDVKPLVKVDTEIDLSEIPQIFVEMKILNPVGIDNPDPVFLAKGVNVVNQQLMGKDKTHVSVTISQEVNGCVHELRCVAWEYAQYFPLSEKVDIVFKISENSFLGKTTIQPQIISHINLDVV